MSNGTHYATDLMNRMKRRKEVAAFQREKLKNMHRTAFFVSSNRLNKILNKDISAKELELVKKSIRTKIKKQNLQITIIGFILFIIPMIVVFIFWEYIF